MTTISTKHRPNRETPIPDVREVEMPFKIEKSEHEGNAVSLGAREPEEGRYTTLSRLTYKGGSRQAPGEASVVPKNHDQVYKEAHTQAHNMRSRSFFMDEPEGFLLSEQRGAHAPPPPGSVKNLSEHNRENALYMSSHNMFIADTEKKQWMTATSTNRASYHQHDNSKIAETQKASADARKLQRQTHFTLGCVEPDWRSDYGAHFTGEQEKVKTTLCKANVQSTINIGSSDVDVKDSLRSLKQVDFVPHNQKPQGRTSSHQMQQTNMIFGFQPSDIQSLHRASYTPTAYVNTKKDGVTIRNITPGAASGMGSSPKRQQGARGVKGGTAAIHGLPPI